MAIFPMLYNVSLLLIYFIHSSLYLLSCFFKRNFVNMVNYIDWFWNITSILHSIWSRCIKLVLYCWILFAKILFRILHLCSWGMLVFGLLLITTLFSFGIRIILAFQNEMGNIPLSYIFCKSLGRIDMISSLNIWSNSHQWSHPGMEYSLREGFRWQIQLS